MRIIPSINTTQIDTDATTFLTSSVWNIKRADIIHNIKVPNIPLIVVSFILILPFTFPIASVITVK